MARLFVPDNSTGDNLQTNSTPFSTLFNATMAAWARTDVAVTRRQAIMQIVDGGSTSQWMSLEVRNSGANVEIVDGGSTNVTTGTVVINTWHHFAATFHFTGPSTRRMRPWLDGSPGTDTAHSRTILGLDRSAIGHLKDATASRPFSGHIAWPAIWNAELTTNEIEALAAGANPLGIRPESLLRFWPLLGEHDPEPPLVGGVGDVLNNDSDTGGFPTKSTIGPPTVSLRWPKRGFFEGAAVADTFDQAFPSFPAQHIEPITVEVY